MTESVEIGEIVAKAWEEHLAGKPPDPFAQRYLLNTLRGVKRVPPMPVSAATRATRATWKKWDAMMRRRRRRERIKLLGRVVAVENDAEYPVLVYADGRRLVVRESEWLKP